MRRVGMAIAVALCGLSTSADAQQRIEWKQVITTPKGSNLPKGAKADILGIELGDSYAELKPKLDALLAESIATKPRAPQSLSEQMASETQGESSSGPLSERKTVIRSSQAPGAASLAAEYVGNIHVKRELPGTGKVKLTEYIRIRLSAPSSGHQVLGLERILDAGAEENQFRVADVLDGLKAKFKAEPSMIRTDPQSTHYRFQFNNGQSVTNTDSLYCQPQYDLNDSAAVSRINPKGDCDVVLIVIVVHGISKAHAKSLRFTLSDNERTKANVTADFEYIRTNMNNFLNQQRGAAPKL